MNHLPQPLVGLKSCRLPALCDGWLLLPQNKVDYWRGGRPDCWTGRGNQRPGGGSKGKETASQRADVQHYFRVVFRAGERERERNDLDFATIFKYFSANCRGPEMAGGWIGAFRCWRAGRHVNRINACG